MRDERSERVGHAIKACAADWAILTSPDSVCYASGYHTLFELGPSPFSGGPACAIVSSEGDVALVVSHEANTTYATSVRSYEGYTYDHDAPQLENYVQAVSASLRDAGVGGAISVEPQSLPASLRPTVDGIASRVIDIGPELRRVRAIKTDRELEQLKYCAGLTGVGQKAALAAASPGRRELEIFGDIRSAVEVAHGDRATLAIDLLTGTDRSSRGTGLSPNLRSVVVGDPIICDLGVRANGYWGDSCNTFVAGDPTPAFMNAYHATKNALDHAVDVLKPGLTAAQLDAEVRGVLRKSGYTYAHHTGHGIGASGQEFPRIVPFEHAEILPDMVLMIEPGTYDPRFGGIRLEWMLHVTETGNEIYSPFEHVMR